MFRGNGNHYLAVGLSALEAIRAALKQVGNLEPATVLDFGSGAGRVTRWLRAALPKARIVAADLRPEDIQFCATEIGAEPWQTSTDIATLEARAHFDLIWSGSVMTHLQAADTEMLLKKFIEWTAPGGMIVTTVHRPYVFERMKGGNAYGLTPDALERVLQQYQSVGYGYADYPHAKGYGISLSSPAWIENLVSRQVGGRLVQYATRGWDKHQDVFSVQRDGV